MAAINLLPWRETQSKEREQKFYIACGVTVAVMFSIIGIIHLAIGLKIEAQISRNNLLNTEIAILDRKIKEIRDLESTKKNLLARMTVIQKLQNRRPLVVHMFDEMVRIMPEGIYITGLSQKGLSLILEGTAQSNAVVSSLMTALEESEWFAQPLLEIVNNTEVKDQQRASSFILSFKLVDKIDEADTTEGEEVI